MRAAPEISFRKTVTSGSTFQWHRMGCKPCLLVWHIQPAQWTQSITIGKRTNVFKLAENMAVFKAKLELRVDEWTLGFLTYFEHYRDFERDWVRVFLPAGARSPVSAFKRVSITSQPQKTSQLGRNRPVTHLWISQVNLLCASRESTAWDHKLQWP